MRGQNRFPLMGHKPRNVRPFPDTTAAASVSGLSIFPASSSRSLAYREGPSLVPVDALELPRSFRPPWRRSSSTASLAICQRVSSSSFSLSACMHLPRLWKTGITAVSHYSMNAIGPLMWVGQPAIPRPGRRWPSPSGRELPRPSFLRRFQYHDFLYLGCVQWCISRATKV